MINCTNHFIKRWVERVVGITATRELNEYIGKNRGMIVEHVNKTYEFAEHIYTGQIGDNVTRNYHIKDDLVFVMNTNNTAFVTILKVDVGFTEELNTVVRRGLVKEIRKLSEEKEEIELQIIDEIADKEHEIAATEEQIKLLQEQLNNLKKSNDFKKEEVKQMKKKSLNTGLELKKHALTLINSRDYKEDLQSMK